MALRPHTRGSSSIWHPDRACVTLGALVPLSQIAEDNLGEARHIADLVGTTDNSGRVDQVRNAKRKVGVRLVRSADDLVSGADTMVDVGEQAERELLCVGKRLVLRRGVEGRAQHHAVSGLKRFGPVTQALTLRRSA
jgi:hypothetical protein